MPSLFEVTSDLRRSAEDAPPVYRAPRSPCKLSRKIAKKVVSQICNLANLQNQLLCARFANFAKAKPPLLSFFSVSFSTGHPRSFRSAFPTAKAKYLKLAKCYNKCQIDVLREFSRAAPWEARTALQAPGSMGDKSIVGTLRLFRLLRIGKLLRLVPQDASVRMRFSIKEAHEIMS